MISVSQDQLHIRSPLLGWDWITVQAAIDNARSDALVLVSTSRAVRRGAIMDDTDDHKDGLIDVETAKRSIRRALPSVGAAVLRCDHRLCYSQRLLKLEVCINRSRRIELREIHRWSARNLPGDRR